MKTLPKQWPHNIQVLRIGRWRMDYLDQETLKTIRKIADKRGATIEEVMDRTLLDFVERRVADRELATKIVPFPMKRLPNGNTSTGNRQEVNFLHRLHAIKGGGQTIPKASIRETKRLYLTRGIKTVA
jgi:hypothetical protein